MNRTKIEWVKNPDGTPGYTWNPITGCLNHVNGLCKGGGFPCYAHRLAHGRLLDRYRINHHIAPYIGRGDNPLLNPFYPRFWPERLLDIKPSGGWWDSLGGRKAKGIFLCDMGEMFGPWVPQKWQEEIFAYIRSDPMDRFYLLTKQPQELVKWSPFPPNCYVGVTVTDARYMADAVANLACIEAKVKYMSFEPLLASVMPKGLIDFLDWLIIGGCTGTMQDLLPLHHKTSLAMVNLNGNRWSLQPQIESVQEIVEAADEAGVKVFLKDNLKPLLPEVPPFYDYFYEFDQTEDHCQLRQEMPSEGGE